MGEGWVELVWLFTDSGVAVGCGAEAAVFAREGWDEPCGVEGSGTEEENLGSGMEECSAHETWSGNGNDPSLCRAPPILWCRPSHPVGRNGEAVNPHSLLYQLTKALCS